MFYSTYLLTLLLLPSLRGTFLIRRQATSGGKKQVVSCFSFVVFGWINYFLLLACFDWVCKAICPSESSIRSPARGSHSFEWIEPGRSTGIGSVWRLSVHMLKSCIHQASCKIILISTDKCHMFHHHHLPLKQQSLWMKCICSRMAQTNSPLLQGKQSTDNLEFKHESFCLLLLVLFPSFHYKCSALGFRTFVCPSLWLTTKEKIAMKFGNTRL
jgi:hypothetical protein